LEINIHLICIYKIEKTIKPNYQKNQRQINARFSIPSFVLQIISLLIPAYAIYSTSFIPHFIEIHAYFIPLTFLNNN